MNENAIDAFDYIVNTRSTYDALASTLAKLESRAKSQRQSPSIELERSKHSQCRCQREWFRMAVSTLAAARADYHKCFAGEEPPDWTRSQTFTIHDLMEVSLTYRDRLPR